jgi:hypothetical protein
MGKKAKIKSKTKIENLPKEIVANYIKTNSYRSYYADGIFGGLTPNGKVYAEFFIQRSVTPKTITYKVQDGILKDEVERTGKEGMVREIEAGVIMDIKTAKIFKDWLEKRITEHDQLLKDDVGK